MDLTVEKERILLEDFFSESRQTLHEYLADREVYFSNSQLFAFISVSPIAIAIASDGALDLAEISMLIDLASYFERDILPKSFDELPQPENVISNEGFRKIIYSELKYLCLHMQDLEKPLIKCLHSLIKLDEQLSREQPPKLSIKQKIKDMMKGVIYNNLGKDVIEEEKIHKVLKQLNLSDE
jgi:hypothetical protein